MTNHLPKMYRGIWIAAHGDLPQPCGWCSEIVTTWGKASADGVIHHIDEDRSNNVIENLLMGHNGCHKRYHATGHVVTEETRAKVGAAQRARKHAPLSAATKAKISASMVASHKARHQR